MLRFNKRGQNAAEYAIVIALVVAVGVAMQTYVKRGLQGGIKFVVDKLKRDDKGTGQYEPYYLESSFDTTISAYKDTEQIKSGGAVERVFGIDGKLHETTRSGYQKIKVPE